MKRVLDKYSVPVELRAYQELARKKLGRLLR